MIECPRCLGKGHVDEHDVKRLGQELRWGTGECAYCNGKGKVSAKMAAAVRADSAYLTTDLSRDERFLLFIGDPGALERASRYETDVELFFKQVEYLHHMGKMDAETIADFFLIDKSSEEDESEDERQEFIEYVEKVISWKKGKS